MARASGVNVLHVCSLAIVNFFPEVVYDDCLRDAVISELVTLNAPPSRP